MIGATCQLRDYFEAIQLSTRSIASPVQTSRLTEKSRAVFARAASFNTRSDDIGTPHDRAHDSSNYVEADTRLIAGVRTAVNFLLIDPSALLGKLSTENNLGSLRKWSPQRRCDTSITLERFDSWDDDRIIIGIARIADAAHVGSSAINGRATSRTMRRSSVSSTCAPLHRRSRSRRSMPIRGALSCSG